MATPARPQRIFPELGSIAPALSSPIAPGRIRTSFEVVDDSPSGMIDDSSMEYLDDPSLEVATTRPRKSSPIRPLEPLPDRPGRMSDLQAGLEQRTMRAAIGSTGKATDTKSLLATFDALQSALQNASPSSEARLIEFHTSGGLNDPIGGRRWRGLLDGAVAALRVDQSPEVVFQPTKELTIQLEEPYRPGKSLKARIKVGAADLKGTIEARSYDRWKAWSPAA